MKKLHRIILASIILFLIPTLFINSKIEDYDKSWSKVDGYVKEGLPKSAIKLVDEIYKTAKAEGNSPQLIKSLIFRVSLQSRFQEDHMLKSISYFEKELASSEGPVRQILHSLIAQIYQAYYQQNRWQINERGTLENYNNTDVSTWDALSFNKIIKKNYLQSLENKSFLQDIKLDDYNLILVEKDTSDFNLYPSLYDLLANRAINYFTNNFDDFEIAPISFDYSQGLLSGNNFLENDLTENSKNEKETIVLGLFKDLILLHKQNYDTIALVDLELRRLDYYLQKVGSSPENDNQYLVSLFDLKKQFSNNPISVKVSYQIAKVYKDYANKYDRLKGEKNRWHNAKAVDVCNEAIEKFPKALYSSKCRNLIKGIKNPDIRFTIREAELSEKPFLGSLSFKNISKVYFKIVKLGADDFLKKSENYNNKEEELKYLDLKAVESWSIDLPDAKDFQNHIAEFKLPALEKGLYFVFVSNDSSFKNKIIVSSKIWISDLSYVLKADGNAGSANMFVLNRESGKPISGVEVRVFKRKYNNRKRESEFEQIGKLISDKEGNCVIKNFDNDHSGSLTFKLVKDDDVLYSSSHLNIYGNNNDQPVIKTWFFADRAIYRPGQTVYFKGIITENLGNDYTLLENKETKVEFRNANYKEISNSIFVTNDYGSFHGEFVIPKGLLNGSFSIKNSYGNIRIQVEDYKRPTFKVEFDTVKEQYKLGNTVSLKGNAMDYSGSSLENAEVKFRISRESFNPYFRNSFYGNHFYSESIEIANGNITTNTDGSFEFDFEAIRDANQVHAKGISYYFTVHVDVTDITGETQSGSMFLKLSDAYLNLEVESAEVLNLENNKGITINATNSSDVGVEALTEIKISKIASPKVASISRDWEMPDVFLMGENEFKNEFPKNSYKDENNLENLEKTEILKQTIKVKGSQTVLSDEIKNLKPGEYFIEISAKDKDGNIVDAKKYFSLYSFSSSTLANNNVLSMMINKTKAQPGEDVILSISSSNKKSKILYEIVNGNKLVERKWLNINASQKNIQIPVREEYRGNFSVNVISIRDNRKYVQSSTISVPFENKKLDVKLETFRDYLTPGAEEEWNISIKGPKGEKVASEILAAMYDASLDKFISNKWKMNLYRNKTQNNRWMVSLFSTSSSYSNKGIYFHYNQQSEKYPEIDWFGYEFYGSSRFLMKSVTSSQNAEITDFSSGEMMDVRDSELENGGMIAPPPPGQSKKTKEEKEMPMPLRTNFSETAFFFPNLKTDAEGNTIISFKTPDALTEWKFMALAHSKDLKVGQMLQNIKAKKELMVIPNVPRFVRQGDEINFTAKIVNFTDEEILTDVEVEFFDALSMRSLSFTVSDLKQKIKIDAKSNIKLSWKLNIPYDLSMISYRIKAKTENYSDGEERSFPVLTNRILVTETMPMFLNANQNKTYNFKNLIEKTAKSESIKNYRYTIELTSNPVWYAIQALPYLAENKNQSTLSAFSRYYSNAVSSFIVNSNPKIKTVFNAWKQLTPDAFLSNLEKNEELKSAVLEATPWVLEAENETEQKRRIGVLFDLNRLANEKALTFDKLLSTQLSSGAWPWFNGMRDDVYTTQKIVLGFAKLHNKGIIHLSDDKNRERMIKKAVSYLDKEMVKKYERLKKDKKERLDNNHLGSSQVQYLYLRSILISEMPISKNTQEAFNYYSKQAKRYWLKQNEYLQAMIAVSLNKLGYRNEAEAITRSLTERSLRNEEMGMYWRQKMGWYWYQAPVETQAMIIEAFAEIENNPKAIEQMKVWLLKQKQTQAWKTSSATLEAVFALLTTGNELIAENKDVVLKVGGETIEPEEGTLKEAGSGYFKVNWTGEEINNNLADIELKNPNNNIAWAAAYWQYFEDMDKVEASDSPLSVEKKFFVEKFTDDGIVIEPLLEGQKLKTGQKLISRMIIRSDRNMEFVHLKDMRSSALEPINNISGYKYSAGLGYYENITDFSTDFFFRYLKKGTYVLEYEVFVSQTGKFSNGIATIQSMYAPEFVAHSEGIKLVVE
jgi:uncharacterized protein YfaS (alpha-2-macroglobulin family)